MNALYMAVTILAGIGFFVLRERKRVWYGIGEILVALLLIYLAYFPHGPNYLIADDSGGLVDTLMTKTISIFGGIYALVRGLDNIKVGVKAKRAM